MEKVSTKKHWQTYWNTSDHQPVVRHDELLRNLLDVTPVQGKKILEIGVGMGGDSIYLASLGGKVTTLDFTKEALDKVAANAKKEGVTLKVLQADAKHIPLPDESFDIIFHQGFLEHFTDPDSMLREQVRLLRKGGFLLVDVPQRYTYYTLKKHLLMARGIWFAGWEREFSIGELEMRVRSSGLTVVRSYGWGYYGKLYAIRHLRLGSWYEKIWQYIEKTRLRFYLQWCIGVIGQKA